jgi:hypothetical protein
MVDVTGPSTITTMTCPSIRSRVLKTLPLAKMDADRKNEKSAVSEIPGC